MGFLCEWYGKCIQRVNGHDHRAGGISKLFNILQV